MQGIEQNEASVKTKMQSICHEDIEEEIVPWVQDAGSTKSKETKYFKTIALYWQMKALLGKSLIESKIENQKLLL